MPTLYREERNGRYYVNFVDTNGKRVRQTTGTADPRAARVALNRIAAELDKAKALDLGAVRKVRGLTFAEFVTTEYLPHCAPPNRKQTVYVGKVSIAEEFKAAFGEMRLATITTADVQRFLDKVKARGYMRGMTKKT